jgi:hypothetical protein
MDTFLDYIAWISIALAAATVLCLFLATCLTLVYAVIRFARWVSSPRAALSRLPAAARQTTAKVRHELTYLAKQRQKLAGYIHIHARRTKHRA